MTDFERGIDEGLQRALGIVTSEPDQTAIGCARAIRDEIERHKVAIRALAPEESAAPQESEAMATPERMASPASAADYTAALERDIGSLIRTINRIKPARSMDNPLIFDRALSEFTLKELTK